MTNELFTLPLSHCLTVSLSCYAPSGGADPSYGGGGDGAARSRRQEPSPTSVGQLDSSGGMLYDARVGWSKNLVRSQNDERPGLQVWALFTYVGQSLHLPNKLCER